MLGLSPTDWLAVLAAAVLTGLAKTAVPGLASIAVALYALVLPAKESTGVMLVLLLVGDVLAVWSYRRDADFRMLRRLVPAVLAGVGAGALFLHLASNDSTRRLIGAVLLLLVAITLAQRRSASRAPDDASAARAPSPPAPTPAAREEPGPPPPPRPAAAPPA